MQKGRIYETSRSYYVQYRDASGKQVSKHLADKGGQYYSKTCKALQLKRDEVMLEINRAASTRPFADMRIVDFWEQCYVPWMTSITSQGRPRLKPSTTNSYIKLFNLHLRAFFGDKMLSEFRAIEGTRFLDSLTGSHGQRSITQIKGVAQLLFKRAVAEGRIASNPWRDVVLPKSAIATKPSPCYTWKEAAEAVRALDSAGRPDCALIMALCCYLGLRPNEVAALRFEDIEGDWLHIRRGYVRGRLDVPKTVSSAQPVPLPEAIRKQLEIYAGGRTEGWLFPNGGTLPAERIVAPDMKHLAGLAPVDLPNLSARVIRPILKARGIPWKSLKAGRTGACTAIVEGQDLQLARRMLRHKDMLTTARFYDKGISDRTALEGIRKLQLPE